jgi:VWFA-related protein
MNQRSSSHFLLACCLALGFLTFPERVSAQSDRLNFGSLLKVDVELVTFNFTAVDGRRQNIASLTKEDVVIYEDEVSQEIAFFDAEPMPLSLIVLVDVSDSIKPFSRQIEATTRILPELLHSEDDAAVLAFSNVPNLLQEFTPDKERIRSALQRARSEFSGASNINDSIYVAAKTIRSAPADRQKVMLLISDGKGNRGDRERALDELKACGATFMGVGVGLAKTVYQGALLMKPWIKQTGGTLCFYSTEAEMRPRLRDILERARRQYAAAYISSNKRRDGSFRRLRLTISERSPLATQGITIQGPSGYYAPGDDSRKN